MRQAIEAMRRAFEALSAGRVVLPARIHLPVARHAGVSLIMPSLVEDEPARDGAPRDGAPRDDDASDQALAVKVVSLFDGNRARGLPRIQASVLVLEPDTGRALALLEGATLTSIRTAAASGAATDQMARANCETLALFGASVQARAHLEAMCAVRPIRRAWIVRRSSAPLDDAWHELARRLNVDLRLADSPRQALAAADLICTTTTSAEPVFEDSDLADGAHLNAIGSYTRGAREVPAATVARARVVVDQRDAAWHEAGDLIQPLEARVIARSHIQAELGELLLGRVPGRVSDRQITLFKSVGIAVQDALAAKFALAHAQRLGLGTHVEW